MFKKFLWLEWKAFWRSSSFAGNVIIKIFMAITAVNLAALFLAAGAFTYMAIDEELHRDPLAIVSKYIIYYLAVDLILRLLMQKIPVINIRPVLTLPVKRGTTVNFAMGKTFVAFFTIMHAFYFIPFTVTLIMHGKGILPSALWLIGMWAMIYINNLLNMLLNDKTYLFIAVIAVMGSLGALQYYNYFDITLYTGPFFNGFYTTSYLVIIPVLIMVLLWRYAYKHYTKTMYLDTGLKGKHEIAKTEDLTWLNRFGLMGTFLKNDIKLIKRNARPRKVVGSGVFFLFYGMLFITGMLEMYNGPYWKIFGSIMVTNGFMFTFGQLVPSWDSAYYPLMMSQNIKYRDYITAKWWLVVIATAISTVIASFYLYFGVQTYLLIVATAIYNIGVNSHIVLLTGAFIKTPVDLTTAKQAFGQKQAFNFKVMLLAIPKIIVPMLLYILGRKFFGESIAIALVAGVGVLGFAFKNMVFTAIEKVYVSEKYKTIDAYKQKN